MPVVSELLLSVMTALLTLPAGADEWQVSELEQALTVVDHVGADHFAHQGSLDHHYESGVEKVNDAMRFAPREGGIPPTGSATPEPSDVLPNEPLHDVATVSRDVLPHASAGVLDSTRSASLMISSTMRGFTIAQRRTPPRIEADYAALAGYGANLARIGVMLDVDAGLTTFSISQLERDHMQTTVKMAEKYGFKVVITITAGPFSAKNQVIWRNLELQSSLASIWAGIAEQFKGNPAIAGYELINEPMEPRHRTGQPFNPAGPDEWRPLSIAIINAIRTVDPNCIIVWMPSPGGPEQFWPGFKNPVAPLPFRNIVYSFHFYVPHPITHQGVGSYPLNRRYPDGYRKDRAHLVDRLQYVKAFGELHGVPIFVGEFGFNRNSPHGSREQWFEDCLELFEQYGWNWAVHAFRNWEGWDTEIGPEVPAYATGPRRPDAPIITMLKRKFLLNP